MTAGHNVGKQGKTFEDQKLQQAEMARLNRENGCLEEDVAFLKKVSSVIRETAKSTAWMQEVGQRR